MKFIHKIKKELCCYSIDTISIIEHYEHKYLVECISNTNHIKLSNNELIIKYNNNDLIIEQNCNNNIFNCIMPKSIINIVYYYNLHFILVSILL
jgi:hypothetical protein